MNSDCLNADLTANHVSHCHSQNMYLTCRSVRKQTRSNWVVPDDIIFCSRPPGQEETL